MCIVLITRYRYFFYFWASTFQISMHMLLFIRVFDYIFDISMCCLFLFNLITVYS